MNAVQTIALTVQLLFLLLAVLRVEDPTAKGILLGLSTWFGGMAIGAYAHEILCSWVDRGSHVH